MGLPVQREYEAPHIMIPSPFLAFLNLFQVESVNVVDQGLFGQVVSGSIIILPDQDLTFLTRNLCNLCNFFVQMVQFVFDYIHISSEKLYNFYKNLAAIPLCTVGTRTLKTSQLFTWPGLKGRDPDPDKITPNQQHCNKDPQFGLKDN
jgi:hypothetical protein